MQCLLVLLATCHLGQALRYKSMSDQGEVQPCIHDSRLEAITPEQVKARNSMLQTNDTLPELKGIFYINLATSPLRKARIENLVKMTAPKNAFIKRWDAIGKTAAQKANINEFTQHGIHEYMKKTYQAGTMWATVGVYLSHAKLLKNIYQNWQVTARKANECRDCGNANNEMYLILEDDAILIPDWHHDLMNILPDVPKDWDMLRIGYGTDSNLRCEDKINHFIYENRGPTRNQANDKGFYAGNTAYLVRPQSVPKILKQLAAMPLLDVDGTMISKENGMRVYGVANPLAFHGNGMGLSDRMWSGINPFSLAETDSKVEADAKAKEQDYDRAMMDGVADGQIPISDDLIDEVELKMAEYL